MKIDIIGASNTALSMYRDISGEYRQTMHINLKTVLAESMACEVDSHIALTVAKIGDIEKSYAECASELSGGDVLIIQGTGNDYAMNVETGDEASKDVSVYYGALNYISDCVKGKYKRILFTTGFNTGSNQYCKYNKAIVDVAQKNGFVLVDFFFDKRFSGREILPDKEHMSEAGLSLYADKIIDALKN